MRWFHGLPGAPRLSTRQIRQVDHAGTSLVLNIAQALIDHSLPNDEGCDEVCDEGPETHRQALETSKLQTQAFSLG
jgi:hypothetical protein